MAEHAGLECAIKISGAALALTDEPTSTTDDQNYQITNVLKRVFDRDTVPTIEVGGVATAEVYTVNYLSGKVTFATVDAGRGAVTVTGYYLPMTTAAYAYTASKNEAVDIMDVSKFQSTHKERLAGLKSASGALSQFNITDTTFVDALTAGLPVVLEHKNFAAEEPTRFWVLLESSELSAAIADPQSEAVTWVSHDEWLTLGV